MSKMHKDPRKTVPGFWARLALAAEAMGESYQERLEKRVGWLEAEVERLSAVQKKPARSGGMTTPGQRVASPHRPPTTDGQPVLTATRSTHAPVSEPQE